MNLLKDLLKRPEMQDLRTILSRRFIQMFSDVVMEVPKSYFEKIIDEIKEKRGIKYDTELTEDDLKELIVRFKQVYKENKNQDFPQEPKEQLIEAVKAVFRSWDNREPLYTEE